MFIVLPEYVIRDILTEDMIAEVCLPSQVIADLMNHSFNEGNEYNIWISFIYKRDVANLLIASAICYKMWCYKLFKDIQYHI